MFQLWKKLGVVGRHYYSYLSTLWKFHGGESKKITIFNRLFKQVAHAPKVATISMGERFGNFVWFKSKPFKNQQKIGRCT